MTRNFPKEKYRKARKQFRSNKLMCTIKKTTKDIKLVFINIAVGGITNTPFRGSLVRAQSRHGKMVNKVSSTKPESQSKNRYDDPQNLGPPTRTRKVTNPFD